MLAIRNNMMAANAARYLGRSYDALAESVERLSSGLRINGAKDDAAGMAVRELMRADVAVLQQGSRNAQDGVSLLQTMEGAMATMDTALVRMKQLAEQASTGSYPPASVRS
jgi:flagellin